VRDIAIKQKVPVPTKKVSGNQRGGGKGGKKGGGGKNKGKRGIVHKGREGRKKKKDLKRGQTR